MIELIAPDKLAEQMAKDFAGVSPERKAIIVQSVRNARDREELHKIFSEGLDAAELEFYRAIVMLPEVEAVDSTALPEVPGESAGADESRAAGRRTAAKAASPSAP